VLVELITIGDGAAVGSGSVITDSVEADSLALGGGSQTGKAGGAKKGRELINAGSSK